MTPRPTWSTAAERLVTARTQSCSQAPPLTRRLATGYRFCEVIVSRICYFSCSCSSWTLASFVWQGWHVQATEGMTPKGRGGWDTGWCTQGAARARLRGDPWIMKPLPHAVTRPELWWRRGPECLKDTRLLQKLVCKGKKILLPPVTSTSAGCSNPCLPSARSIVDST